MTNTALILLFAQVSQAYGLPPGMLSALCFVESGHHTQAVHKDDGVEDSVGLCQIHYSTAKQLFPNTKPSDLYNPRINAKIAGAYLRYQYNRYGRSSWERAAVAYNKGNATQIYSSRYSQMVFKSWMEKR